MGEGVLVIGGLVLLAAMVVGWHLTFSVDPRVHPHPFVLKWIEPPWDDWDALTWDEKMRIFRRRQVVHWVFVIIAGILFVGLFLYGIELQSASALVPTIDLSRLSKV
jgi:hypothetical protein